MASNTRNSVPVEASYEARKAVRPVTLLEDSRANRQAFGALRGQAGSARSRERHVASFLKSINGVSESDLKRIDDIIGYTQQKILIDQVVRDFVDVVADDIPPTEAISPHTKRVREEAQRRLQNTNPTRDPVSGVILYGPHGTGKTSFAEGIVREVEEKLKIPCTFYRLNASAILDSAVGRTGKDVTLALRHVLEGPRPAVLFIDEADSLFGTKGGDKAAQREAANAAKEALSDLAKERGVIVVLATNDMRSLDAAVTRQGRFDHKIEVGYPSVADKVAILEFYMKRSKLPPLSRGVSIRDIARNLCDGKAVGAELEGFVKFIPRRLEVIRNGVASGAIPVIIQEGSTSTDEGKGKKKKNRRGKDQEEPSTKATLLEPNPHAQLPRGMARPKTAEAARQEYEMRFDPVGGMSLSELGIELEREGNRIKNVKITRITAELLQYLFAEYSKTLFLEMKEE